MDYKQKVKDKQGEQAELLTRWKADEELLYLEKYVMKDAGGKNVVPDIVNVTLNRPAVFAANIIAALGTTSEQRVVESEVKDFDTTYIEDFQKRAFAAANHRLKVQGKILLNPFFDTQFCIRGRGAARCYFYMKDDILIPDIAPWDARYVTYEIGVDGLEWGGYETMRTKAAIEAEYEKELNHFRYTVSGKSSNILDVWDTEHNEVWFAGKKIVEQEHPFGFCPVVIQIVPLGYGAILLGTDQMKNEGESIFFLIRDVISELNRLASIMQTLNLKSVKPPIKLKKRGGGKGSKYDDVMDMATATTMDIDEDIQTIDFGDAQRSAQTAIALIDTAIKEGSLSSADLGLIGSPPASGIRAIIAGENRDQVIHPRLEAKGGMNQQLAGMLTRQVILIGGSVELGVPGHKRTFETSKLEGEYETTYKYTAKSPVTDAGLYSLAAAAGDSLSKKYKRENIYQLQDPDGEENQLRWEEAEMLSPAIKMFRTLETLIDMDEDVEAELMSEELGVNLEQMLAGEISQQPKPEKAQEPKQVMPMFGGGQPRVEGEG